MSVRTNQLFIDITDTEENEMRSEKPHLAKTVQNLQCRIQHRLRPPRHVRYIQAVHRRHVFPGPCTIKHTSTHTMGWFLSALIQYSVSWNQNSSKWDEWQHFYSILWTQFDSLNVRNIHQMSLEIKTTPGEPRGSSDVPEPRPEAPSTCWLTPAQ